MLGSETAETNLRTLLQPCYLQLLGVAVGERDCGDESADAAVTMLFATVGRRCWKRDCGDESVDAAVTMLFAAVGGRLLGVDVGERDTEETNLRTVLLPCYLQLLGWTCCAIPLLRMMLV